jgi:uncharacterized protein
LTVIIRKKTVTFRSHTETLVGSLYYPDQKKSLPGVVIAHGIGESSESHNDLAEHLAEHGVAALTIDMRGHGSSSGERFCMDMASWSADLIAAIEHLAAFPQVDRKRLGLIGSSAGGAAAIEAAVADQRIKTLIVFDATVRNPLKWQHAWVLKSLVMIGKLKKRVTKKEMRVSLVGIIRSSRRQRGNLPGRVRPLPEAWSSFPLPGASESFFNDTWRRLPLLKVPTLVIWGKGNTHISPERAKSIFSSLTCPKEIHVIRGDGPFGRRRFEQQEMFRLTSDWIARRLKR